MSWSIAYAASTGWTFAPEPLLKMLQGLFRGWGQSRVNEKANKVLRDAETRENASKARAAASE